MKRSTWGRALALIGLVGIVLSSILPGFLR